MRRLLSVKSTTGLVILLIAGLVLPLSAVSGQTLWTSGEKSSNYSSTPLWTNVLNRDVNHVATADLNGDDVEDVIATEYTSTEYDENSFVFAIDGANGTIMWTHEIYDGIRSLIVGDVNNDGVADAIIGGSYGGDMTVDGRVRAINGTNGNEIWNFSIGSTISEMTFANLNGDEYIDIVAVGFDDYIKAINGETGTQLWQKYLGSIFVNTVAAADVNDDGIDDIAYGHEYLADYDNKHGVLDGTDGSELWELTVPYYATEAAMGDIDDDGDVEAIFGCLYGDDHGEILVYDGLSGTLEWSYNFGSMDHVNANFNFHILDLDDDKDLDLVVGSYLVDHRVYIFDGDVNTPSLITDDLGKYPEDIVFGDVDDDGIVDLVVAGGDRVMVANPFNGAFKWYYAVDGSINSVAIGDFDNDTQDDIAAGGGAAHSLSTGAPNISVWGLKTVETPLLWEYAFGEYGNAVAVVDIDGDGHDDVITAVSLDDKCTVIDGKTGTDVLWSWTGTDNLYAVTYGDFNNNGQVDVAVAGNDDRITGLDGASGDVLWQFTNPGDQIYRSCLKAADLNLDGNVDVIAGTDDSHVYAISGETGTELWNYDMGGDAEEVEIAQMNGTGPEDVIVSLTNGSVVIVDGSNGSLLWSYTIGGTIAYIEVYDVNEDDVPDIAAAKTGAAGAVWMIDGFTHDTLWTKTVSVNGNGYALGHGDIDDDKTPDVLVGGTSTDMKVHVLDGLTGTEITFFTIGSDIECVIGYDVDMDGVDEAVVGGADNTLYVFDNSKGTLFSYSCADEVKHVAIGDISNDGEPNIACLTFGSDGVAYAFKSLVAEPNSAPLEPFSPYPADGATGVPVNVVLNWSASDPDGDDVTFDVYLGTSQPLTEVSTQQTENSYNPPGDLAYETAYMWQIVVKDEHGANTVGPVWHFTTQEPWICGDANADNRLNVSDAVNLINYVFSGGLPPDPLEVGDCNCDTLVNVSDAVVIINYVFSGGYQPCDTNNDGTPDC